jgi:hypothetical protein
MPEDICVICERMRRASKRPPSEFKRLCYGGRRAGAGRKPSTLKGILKKLPKQIAEILERELRAKAELFLLEFKLERLTKVKVGEEFAEESFADNSDIS